MEELNQQFSIDCWQCELDAAGFHYTLGICTPNPFSPGVPLIRPQPILHGQVLLYDNAERFKVESVTQRPKGISSKEAKRLLSTIFDHMSQGGEYTDDWVWRPIELEQFLSESLDNERVGEVAAALRHACEFASARKNVNRIKEWL